MTKRNLDKIADNTSDIAQYYRTKTENGKFLNFAKKHPIRAYFRAGAFGFATVFLGNLMVGLLNKNPPINPYTNPQTFAWTNLTKSFYFWFIWPSIPFMIISDNGRKDLFILGKNVTF